MEKDRIEAVLILKGVPYQEGNIIISRKNIFDKGRAKEMCFPSAVRGAYYSPSFLLGEGANMQIYNGDCLEVMQGIADKSVDMILCDLPYGTTSASWDIVIPLEEMWKEYNRIIKPNCAIVLFCTQPFTSELIHSNLKGFKYCFTWDKKIPSGMGYAKYRPMQQTEDIAVFTSKGEKTRYYPQLEKRDKPIKAGGNNVPQRTYGKMSSIGNGSEYKKTYEYKNPTTLLRFDKIRKGALHPTEKPVPLLEYLIKTYTTEGDLVLDNCMGSGSTGVAALNTGRDFIGIELDKGYFEIAESRLC